MDDAHTDISIDLKTVYEYLTCPICYDILKDPVMEMPNQHIFCRKCINNYLCYNHFGPTKCPICKELIMSLHVPLFVINLLSTISMKCKFCEWKGKTTDYDKHKKSCEEFVKINKQTLENSCEKIKSILSKEINAHLISTHGKIFDEHVKDWEWLNSDKRDWKWWWWSSNEWWENKPCEECNRLCCIYRAEIEEHENVRKEMLDLLI
jgi:hypothetical protein